MMKISALFMKYIQRKKHQENILPNYNLSFYFQ